MFNGGKRAKRSRVCVCVYIYIYMYTLIIIIVIIIYEYIYIYIYIFVYTHTPNMYIYIYILSCCQRLEASLFSPGIALRRRCRNVGAVDGHPCHHFCFRTIENVVGITFYIC